MKIVPHARMPTFFGAEFPTFHSPTPFLPEVEYHLQTPVAFNYLSTYIIQERIREHPPFARPT